MYSKTSQQALYNPNFLTILPTNATTLANKDEHHLIMRPELTIMKQIMAHAKNSINKCIDI